MTTKSQKGATGTFETRGRLEQSQSPLENILQKNHPKVTFSRAFQSPSKPTAEKYLPELSPPTKDLKSSQISSRTLTKVFRSNPQSSENTPKILDLQNSRLSPKFRSTDQSSENRPKRLEYNPHSGSFLRLFGPILLKIRTFRLAFRNEAPQPHRFVVQQ